MTTRTSGFSASSVRFAEATFGSPSRSVEWTIWRWRFDLVDDVGVDDPERADACGREVERCGRAEPARPDEQDACVEETLLALLADLGDEQVPAVARALLRCEGARGIVTR